MYVIGCYLDFEKDRYHIINTIFFLGWDLIFTDSSIFPKVQHGLWLTLLLAFCEFFLLSFQGRVFLCIFIDRLVFLLLGTNLYIYLFIVFLYVIGNL